jgi:hypothetical protein
VRRPAAVTAAALRLAAGLLLLAALGACVGAARAPVDSFATVGGGDTVVVGRVELVPALRKNEQRITTMNARSFENRLFLLADENLKTLTKEPTVADYTGRIETTIGETFFVRSSNKRFYIRGGMMYLDLGRDVNQVYFPGSLLVPLKAEDKAVYIGTLQYHRNEFWEITKVAVVDDYERANAEFKKKFGTKYALRKALLTTVK